MSYFVHAWKLTIAVTILAVSSLAEEPPQDEVAPHNREHDACHYLACCCPLFEIDTGVWYAERHELNSTNQIDCLNPIAALFPNGPEMVCSEGDCDCIPVTLVRPVADDERLQAELSAMRTSVGLDRAVERDFRPDDPSHPERLPNLDHLTILDSRFISFPLETDTGSERIAAKVFVIHFDASDVEGQEGQEPARFRIAFLGWELQHEPSDVEVTRVRLHPTEGENYLPGAAVVQLGPYRCIVRLERGREE